MNGGTIAIYPNTKTNFEIEGNSIVGNTVLYGATGGSLFASGAAGERFCVRNSGALTVVEGVGDHACEYMTGGEVYIIGPVGKNLGAGMSGGIAYIYNQNKNIVEQVNEEMVYIDKISKKDESKIKNTLEKHFDLTKSKKAKYILDNFNSEVNSFVRIIPKEIERILSLNGINIDDFDFLNPKLD